MIEGVWHVVCDGWCGKVLGQYGDNSYEPVHPWEDQAKSYRNWGFADDARIEAGWYLYDTSTVFCPDCNETHKA